MNAKEIKQVFSKYFDVVGIIKTEKYLEEAKKMHKEIPFESYQTMVVLGLSYPIRHLKHTHTHLVPSFYTFGKDYHLVLKKRIEKAMENILYPYHYGVDNHPHQERLAAVLSGVGYFAKNQLIINKSYGTYLFLGLVFIDMNLDEEITLDIDDDCGSCRKCISACPTQALNDDGYDISKCISFFNQEKKVLTHEEIQSNYTLFGCDICQMVCPKNINIKKPSHNDFELTGKEMVSIIDLFSQSEKEFRKTYDEMSFLWKGKTILMRNALALLVKHQNNMYNDLIEESLHRHQVPWYRETAIYALNQLKRKEKL